MKIVDLNVLLYAINQDATHHERLRTWWELALRDEETIGLAWVVVLGFLRLTTSPKVFPRPLSADQAISTVDAWLGRTNIRVVQETDEQWRILREILSQAGTAGNLTTDAHLAALAISYGAPLISCDTDFARFARLRWVNPLQD